MLHGALKLGLLGLWLTSPEHLLMWHHPSQLLKLYFCEVAYNIQYKSIPGVGPVSPCCRLLWNSWWLFRVIQYLRWHQLEYWLHLTDGMLLIILLPHTEHNQICCPGLGSTPVIRSINWLKNTDEWMMKYETSVTIFGWSFVLLHVVSVRRTNRRGNPFDTVVQKSHLSVLRHSPLALVYQKIL